MSLHRRRELISIEVHQKRRLKNIKISEQSVVVKLGQKKEFIDTFTIDGGKNQPKFVLAVNSYRLRHFN